jgi:hypothetical protein
MMLRQVVLPKQMFLVRGRWIAGFMVGSGWVVIPEKLVDRSYGGGQVKRQT